MRCTTAGGGAGVDGVENAAETLPLAANAGGEDAPAGCGEGGSGITARGSGSGMALRVGGVNGAPKEVDKVGGTGSLDTGVAFRIDGTLRGENGGVRVRGRGETSGEVGGGGTGAVFNGATGARGGSGTGAAAGAGGTGGLSTRGTGGGHDDVVEGAGVPARDMIGRTPAGVCPSPGATDAAEVASGRSSPQFTAAPTGISPPHTEHRARIETLVIFAGSSRKTDRHSGHETFI